MIAEAIRKLFGGEAPRAGEAGARLARPSRFGMGNVMRKNPAAEIQHVRARRSMSAAYGYAWVSDAACWDLLDEMAERDAIIGSCQKILLGTITSRGRTFEVQDKDAPQASESLDLVKSVLGDDAAHLVELIATRLIRHGVANIEQVWQVRESDGMLVPTGFFECHPGQFGYDQNLSLYMIGTGSDVLAPPFRFVHAYLPAPYQSGFGEAPAWPLRFEYAMKRDTRVSQLRNAELNGHPIIHGEVPADATDGQKLQADLLRALSAMDVDSQLVTARGEKVSVHQRAQSQGGQDIYNSPIDRGDLYIRLRMLGSELAAVTGANGSRALGEVHERTMVNLISPFANRITKAINEQVIMPLVRVNLGMNAPLPVLTIDTQVEADAVSVRETLRTAKETGVPVPVDAAREMLGIRAALPGEPLIGDSAQEQAGFAAKFATVEDAYAAYHDAVNMTASQLRRWAETECSRKASVSRAPIQRNLRLLSTPKSDWTDDDAADAMRTVSFVGRMRGAMGDPANTISEECPFTKAEVSLANWAWASPRIKRAMKFHASDVTPERYGKATNAGLRRMALEMGRRADAAKENAAAESAEDARPALVRVLSDTITRWRRRYPLPGQKLDRLAMGDISTRGLEPDRHMQRMVASMMILGSLERSELAGAVRESREQFRGGIEDIAPEFADAVAWMNSRGILSTAALEQAAKAFAQEYGIVPDVARQYLRERTLAMAGAANEGVAGQIQGLLSRAIDRGETAAEFLSGIDSVIDGGLPPGLDAYWNNVFRTEVANAYQSQQIQTEQDPDIRDYLWGYEYSNPRDGRSRPSHAALNGVQVELNGPAFTAIGRTPFGYQCRCSMVPLMLIDKNDIPYRTKKDAAALADGLARFGCDCAPLPE